MKNYIIPILDKIEKYKQDKPKTYKLIFIGLCCIAPIEMLAIYLTLKAVRKYA